MTDDQYRAVMAKLEQIERRLDGLERTVASSPPAKAPKAPKERRKMIDGKWHVFIEGTGWVRTFVRDKFPAKDDEF